MSDKKAISPVIATVLLVLMAIVLAGIILLWARGFITEQVSKFDRPIEDSCSSISLTAAISGTEIAVTNTGNVPIYKMNLVIEGDTIAQGELNLMPGASVTISASQELGGKSVALSPVLLGKSDKGVNEFLCPKSNWIIAQ